MQAAGFSPIAQGDARRGQEYCGFQHDQPHDHEPADAMSRDGGSRGVRTANTSRRLSAEEASVRGVCAGMSGRASDGNAGSCIGLGSDALMRSYQPTQQGRPGGTSISREAACIGWSPGDSGASLTFFRPGTPPAATKPTLCVAAAICRSPTLWLVETQRSPMCAERRTVESWAKLPSAAIMRCVVHRPPA